MTKTVLAIDGGGVRGILPAMILAEIERRTTRPAYKLFDVIAGTSTGAVIAAMATRQSKELSPLSAKDIVELYKEDAKRYFKRRFNLGWFRPLYDNNSAEKVLQEQLGESDLASTATDIIVPVYALRDQAPRVHYFNTLSAKSFGSENHTLWQVARGATAAPTFFSPFTADSSDGKTKTTVIDGGVYANNPAMLGWLHAHQSLSPQFQTRQDGQVFSLDEQFITDSSELRNTVVVSIGTGFSNQPINRRRARKWGKIGWLLPVLNVIFEGQSEQVRAEVQIAESVGLLDYFERLQPLLDAKIHHGDASKITYLEEVASEYLALPKTDAAIDRICKQLLAAKP